MVGVLGSFLTVKSPFPELLRLDARKNSIMITQRNSDAYVDVHVKDQDIEALRLSPKDKCFVQFYRGSPKKTDEGGRTEGDKIEEGRRPVDAYWMLVMLPSSIHALPLTQWLSNTGFSDKAQEEFNIWMRARHEEDDYTVIIIDIRKTALKAEFNALPELDFIDFQTVYEL
jgi:hypothetical protein